MVQSYGEAKVVEVLLDMDEYISKRIIHEPIVVITLPNGVDPADEIERLRNEIAINVIRLAGIKLKIDPPTYQGRYDDDDDEF